MARIAVVDEGQSVPGVRMFGASVRIETDGVGFIDLTEHLRAWLRGRDAGYGLLTLFIRHTSASLTIQENADPNVLHDLKQALDRLAPEDAGWRHFEEGPDDMPAHVKTTLTDTSLSIPVAAGQLVLGTWQAVYLAEHRRSRHAREVVLRYYGS